MFEININYCECGCGGITKPRSRFLRGHNIRVNNPSRDYSEVRVKISQSNTGKRRSEESKRKQSKSTRNSVRFKKAMKDRKPPRQGTDTSLQARKNMSVGAINRKTTEEGRESRKQGMLNYFSILENRIKRVEELKQRLEKRTQIKLPRLGNIIYHRSSYEEKALFLLDSKLEVSSIYYEKVNIPYINKDGMQKIYVPDILVTLKNNSRILIEVKPKVFLDDENNQLKFKSAQEWAEKNNVIFCIWTEDILYNSSSTTMSLQAIVEATVANFSIKEELKV